VSRITWFTAALFLALFIALPSRPVAHEIPNDVTVQSFVKPEGQRLRFLVRVPLASMLDVDWPRQGPDTIDLSRAEPFLRDAATLWLADNVTMYEGSTALAYPQVIAVTAHDSADHLYAHANRGTYIAVAAPGVDILVPILKRGHMFMSGTSMSSAYVAGIMALLLERAPNLSPERAARILMETAGDLGAPGRDDEFGAGRVDARAALDAMLGGAREIGARQ